MGNLGNKAKVGILTIHHHENDGSVMQAYCVRRLLDSVLPDATVEYANVFPFGHAVRVRQSFKKLLLGKLPPGEAGAAMRKTLSFSKFFRTYIQPKGPPLVTNDTKAGVGYLMKHGYSTVILGSDTVWELGNRWCGMPPPPNYYFTPGLDSAIQSIGFALSCDPIGMNIPSDIDRAALETALGRHTFITYRDEPTKQLLLELGVSPQRLDFMPDPTLIWDFSDLVKPFTLPARMAKPVGIAIDNATLREQIAAEVRASGCEPVSLLGVIKGASWQGSAALSVNQRLGLFRSLAMLITDRFHSSIFTLKLNAGRIPVIGVEDEQKWPQPNSKLRDLFQRMDIEEFLVRPRSQPVTQTLIAEYADRWPSSGERVRHHLSRLEQDGHQMLGKIATLINEGFNTSKTP